GSLPPQSNTRPAHPGLSSPTHGGRRQAFALPAPTSGTTVSYQKTARVPLALASGMNGASVARRARHTLLRCGHGVSHDRIVRVGSVTEDARSNYGRRSR